MWYKYKFQNSYLMTGLPPLGFSCFRSTVSQKRTKTCTCIRAQSGCTKHTIGSLQIRVYKVARFRLDSQCVWILHGKDYQAQYDSKLLACMAQACPSNPLDDNLDIVLLLLADLYEHIDKDVKNLPRPGQPRNTTQWEDRDLARLTRYQPIAIWVGLRNGI